MEEFGSDVNEDLGDMTVAEDLGVFTPNRCCGILVNTSDSFSSTSHSQV